MNKPQIILDVKPAKIIRWFTEHWDKEIGALGIGKVDKGNIIIEKLVFPNQLVNGAHIHFEPEDWKPVMEELSVEELGKIIFYWHKHPNNCVTASSDDEENTFGAFMAPEAKRKIFGFLQTALKDSTSGSYEYEARICLNKPIRLNTKDVELIMMDDNDVKEECEQIIKDKVTEGFKGTSSQPGTAITKAPVATPVIGTKPDITPLSVRNLKPHEQNRFVPPVDYTKKTSDISAYVREFKVKEKDGAIVLIYSSFFTSCVDGELNSKEMLSMCNGFSHKVCESTGLYMTVLQPFKKKLKELLRYWQRISENITEFEHNGTEEDMETANYETDVDDIIDLYATNAIHGYR